MEHITDLIKTDINKNPYYNEVTLNLMIKCLYNKELLKQMDQTIYVGVCHLSRYIDYFYKLKEYFDLGINIIELGFGEFPIMSFLIDHEQKNINRGSIHAYDGSSIEFSNFDIENNWKNKIAPLGNINYNFNYIKEYTTLPDYDLIFGIKACHGLIDLVKKANMDKKDFFLVPCDCYPKNFINYLYNLAKNETTKDQELLIDDSIEKSFPILVRRKKQ